MKIEEILIPGELVLYNGKTIVNEKKVKILIMILIMGLDGLAFFYYSNLKDIPKANLLLGYAIMICLFLFAVYNLIMSFYIIANNNKTEYWITNKRVIAHKKSGVLITNNIESLSAISFLSKKRNIGTIILYFGIEHNFLKGLLASIINTKHTDKVILMTNVGDPFKVIKILRNLNDEAILNDDHKYIEKEEYRLEQLEEEKEKNKDA